jgi:hypothetical protein
MRRWNSKEICRQPPAGRAFPGVLASGFAGGFFAVFEAVPRFLVAVFFPLPDFAFPALAPAALTHLRPPRAFA